MVIGGGFKSARAEEEPLVRAREGGGVGGDDAAGARTHARALEPVREGIVSKVPLVVSAAGYVHAHAHGRWRERGGAHVHAHGGR